MQADDANKFILGKLAKHKLTPRERTAQSKSDRLAREIENASTPVEEYVSACSLPFLDELFAGSHPAPRAGGLVEGLLAASCNGSIALLVMIPQAGARPLRCPMPPSALCDDPFGTWQVRSLLSVKPAASFQVQAVSAVKSNAFLFQQAPLEDVAAIAGQAVGHLALGVDDTVPRDSGCRVKALEDAANKAGPPRQAGHRGDLAIGCNPAKRDAADHGANGFDGFIALELGSLKRPALRQGQQLASIPGCPASH